MLPDETKSANGFLLLLPALFFIAALSCCTPVANMTWNGEYYLMSGDYDKAIDEYTRAINLNPSDAPAYLGRATTYEEMGYPRKALDDYNAAVALIPGDSGVYVDRGLIYELLGDYRSALKDYTKAAELDPTNATAYFHCGNIYMDTGDTRDAFEKYRSAARLGHIESQDILKSKGMTW